MRINSIVGLLFIIILLGSCRKDNEAIIIIEEEIEQPRIYHDALVTGRVVDESGITLSQSEVSIIDFSTNTNAQGEFAMLNVRVNAAGSLVKSSLKGYLPAYVPIFVGKNELIDVKLIHRLPNLIKVESQESKDLIITDQITSNIGNALFEYENGNTFNGKANVAIELITDESLIQNFPVGLSARDQELNVGVLDVNKILSIHAFDENGVQLKLKYGKSFKINVEDSGITSLKPFLLDEIKESWIEFDNIDFIGNKTMLTIDRMGPLAFGGLASPITITAVLMYKNGDIADHQQYTITNDKVSFVGVTNSLGELLIPTSSGKTHSIVITDLCGNVLTNYIFETGNKDKDLGPISINGNRTLIKFDLMNCDLSEFIPTKAGFAEITFGENRYVHKSEGNVFELNLLYCREASMMTIKDGSEVLKSLDIKDFITNSSSVVDIHKLYLCNDDIAGVLKIGDKTKVFNKAEFYILIESAGMLTPLTFTDISDFTLSLDSANGVGIFPVDDFNSAAPDLVACNSSCGTLQMILTVFGPNIGDRSVGHLSGELDGKMFSGFFDDIRFN